MAIILNENSYITLQEAIDYHTARGNTAFTDLATAEQESLIIKATDYIETMYYNQFINEPLDENQSLLFPRVDILTPKRVKEAIYTLTIKLIDRESLIEDADKRIIEDTIAVITTKYDLSSNQLTQYVDVMNLLSPYLIKEGSSINGSVYRV